MIRESRLARAVKSISRELADFAGQLEADDRRGIEVFLSKAAEARQTIQPPGDG